DRALYFSSLLSEHMSEPEFRARVSAVYVQKGRVLELRSQYPAAIENYQAMVQFAQEISDEAIQADAFNHLVTAQVVLAGPTPPNDELLEQARVLGQRVGDPTLSARALWNRGLVYRFTDTPRAVDSFEQALALADANNLRELAALVRLDMNIAEALLGHPRRAKELVEQALAEFRALDMKPMITDALANLAGYAYGAGDPKAARAYAEEGRQLSQSIENPWGVLYNQLYLLTFDLEAGNLQRVLQKSEENLARARQIGNPYFILNSYSILVLAYLEWNQLERAQSLADEALDAFGGQEGSPLSLWARLLQGGIQLKRGELRSAHELMMPMVHSKEFPLIPFDEHNWFGQLIAELALLEERLEEGLGFCNRVLQQFQQEEQNGLAAPMYYHRARLYQAEGQLEKAERDALQAADMLEQAENRLVLWRAEGLLAEIYEAQGKREEARTRRANAREVVIYIAEHSPLELREGYLNSEEVQRVLKE
ncbi:MAG TPA: hypothetical protein VFD70_01235, partial [Anaerolineae bacterium]|nr:hypothetical protein [Anaerolineae bacterium]